MGGVDFAGPEIDHLTNYYKLMAKTLPLTASIIAKTCGYHVQDNDP